MSLNKVAVIELKKLEFGYRTGKSVLEIHELNITKGEAIFLYGPSGCGKTTFLSLVSGILAPRRGSIRLLDKEFEKLSVSEKDRFRNQHIGYIFQLFNLVPFLTVKENLLLPFWLSTKQKKMDQNLLHDLVHKLGIHGILDSRATLISVGQAQRVAAARALITRPEILLADEPTSSLDKDAKQAFIQILFQICREFKTTLVFVSHDDSLEPFFDRSISLPKLNLAQTGPI